MAFEPGRQALLTVHKGRPHNYFLLFVGSFPKEVL
jgi:hypothetical protein